MEALCSNKLYEYIQHHMRRFSEMIINMMKNEKLFYPQGGPIIMSQVG